MRRTVLIVGAVALTVCACSPPATDGTAAPTSGGVSPSPSAPATAPPEIPKVESPIDLARFKQAPCSALTKPQVGDLLGATPDGQARDGAAGPACTWVIPSTTRPLISVVFTNTQDSGTAKIYAAKGKSYRLVEPLKPVDGYPLTAYGITDERSMGRCSAALGTSDTETIGIAAEQSEANVGKKDPCDVAREAAIRVLATIRGGN
ncbi:DUF3558 domain-containing protein [Amycolatopsis sp. EV170708-02-1]|uniref:DUF3558 domain-containing protein n=1 Tax=Amycolatopsis sp. EV170708-02-1 TaxID=2919322 RepID=UPI001F0C32DB|nr:DUF3558 domain-containing protein [Amycolatopsis sp. EV170708-02-1]UMP02314.1 DUF3558 domain-containing protein [Amycolatopsis sp. EV170708-02-1]